MARGLPKPPTETCLAGIVAKHFQKDGRYSNADGRFQIDTQLSPGAEMQKSARSDNRRKHTLGRPLSDHLGCTL